MNFNSNREACPSQHVDDCDFLTGFHTSNKAKLSITSILHSNNRDASSPVVNNSEEFLNRDNTPSSAAGEPEQTNCCQRNHRLLGSFLTVCSAMTFSFSALLGKLLSHLNSFNVGLWTFLLMNIIASFLILFHHLTADPDNSIFKGFYDTATKRVKKSFLFYLWVRSICGASALILFFYAVKYISVGDVIVIDATSPILVYIMAFIFLGEKFRYLMIFTTILAFTGVTLIARPPLFTNEKTDFDMNSVIGVVLSLSVNVCITISLISLKFIGEVHYSITNFSFSLWGTLQCAVVAWASGTIDIPTEPLDIFKMVTIALVFYLGQVFITVALKYQDAGPVGLLRTTEVMFIFIWQWIFLGVIPDIYTWCGGILILLGGLLTIMLNWIITLPETHGLRIKLKCLLL